MNSLLLTSQFYTVEADLLGLYFPLPLLEGSVVSILAVSLAMASFLFYRLIMLSSFNHRASNGAGLNSKALFPLLLRK